MVILHEDGLLQLYLQLLDSNLVDPATDRVDKLCMGPDRLIEVWQQLVFLGE